MAYRDRYRQQIMLLVKVLPSVAKEECFALKGGTAINLFIRNLPRLSVDIDLTYVPVVERSQSLKGIEQALRRIADSIKKIDKAISITASAPVSQTEITKLVVRNKEQVQIKIEVTPVLRGCVYQPVFMPVCAEVEDQFGFVETSVLSFADIYAGKIVAALDRQHPRDLFDVQKLCENEGITDEMRTAFIVYLVSHEHSPHSLLDPVLRDISQDFKQNFDGMTSEPITLETLLEARDSLIQEVVQNMPGTHKDFLRSFYSRNPDWALLGLEEAKHLPAVKWRELNLDKASEGTCEELLRKLELVIGAS